jgi:hypothetical protein
MREHLIAQAEGLQQPEDLTLEVDRSRERPWFGLAFDPDCRDAGVPEHGQGGRSDRASADHDDLVGVSHVELSFTAV